MLVPLDEQSVLATVRACVEHEVEAIAVCLLWSTVNGAHEARIGELLAEHLPAVPVTLSHRLNPVIREYRRASSAAIDASLKPLMQTFLQTLDDDLRVAGFAGNVLISTSFGGSWPTEQVVARPIYSVGSGPAMAPVAGVAYSASEPDLGSGLLVCDTGGTTFDVSLVSEGKIHTSDETWLGGKWTGHITGTRAVDVSSIGAGGGSIIWIDEGGLLHVGPRSAGSDPGPACYGRGGALPTITDAALVLGFLDPDAFLGGRLVLDRGAACGRARTRRRTALARGARARARRVPRDDAEPRHRHPGDHGRAGDRPARPDNRRRRGRERPQLRPVRARARLPAGADAAHGRSALGVRWAVLRRDLVLLGQPVRRDARHRPRGGERRARVGEGRSGGIPRRRRRPRFGRDLAGRVRRRALPEAGVGARDAAGRDGPRRGRDARARGDVPRAPRARLRRQRAGPVPRVPDMEGTGDRDAPEAPARRGARAWRRARADPPPAGHVRGGAQPDRDAGLRGRRPRPGDDDRGARDRRRADEHARDRSRSHREGRRRSAATSSIWACTGRGA